MKYKVIVYLIIPILFIFACGKENLDKKIARLEVAIQKESDNPKLYYQLATLYYEKGGLANVQRAVDLYQKSVALDENYAPGYAGLGVAYAIMYFNYAPNDRHWLSMAHQESVKAVRLDPNLSEAHRALGLSYSGQNQLDKAIDAYKEAIRLKPESARAHESLGFAYFTKGMYDRAIAEYKEAVRLEGDDATFHNNLGLAYLNNNQIDEAISEYKKAIKIDYNLSVAHTNLGVAYEQKGMSDKAQAEFQEAMRLDMLEKQQQKGNR
ncbi:MAG: tetratricopeptide repeat protein [Candidatus Poribacteria bacterium]